MECPNKERVIALLAAIRHGGMDLKDPNYREEFGTILPDVMTYFPEQGVGFCQDDYYYIVNNLEISNAEKMKILMTILDQLSRSSTMGCHYISGNTPDVPNLCPMKSDHDCQCVKSCVDEIVEKHRKQFLGLLKNDPELIDLVPEYFRISKEEHMERFNILSEEMFYNMQEDNK